ncbi:transcriptional regulator, TetR family [Goodfellowiella coeruleoviolacea]|uniref:Transcriptional regulator, TetR family n=1 Tax=Goodfellowiella coeruleoviolacea TaxID=334858 RepID=A0AAE3KMG1_9PSEU|nr:transcriptional regulator, TetR family [Goodfellowiella coeruleoviolacea]
MLARDGGRGLTHRAVDREANVPEGTTKNYFPTRESLLEATAARMADQHRVAVEQLHQSTPDSVSATQVSWLYPALLRRALTDPTQILAMFELYLEAVRRPRVRQALGRMAVANANSAVALHHTVGLPTTPREAGLLDAYFLGLAISLLALPDQALHTIGMTNPDELGLALFTAATTPPQDPH